VNPLIVVLIVVAIAAVILLILALRSGGEGEPEVQERLVRYTEDDRREIREEDIEEEAKRLARLTEGLNKVIEKRTFAARIATDLAQASLKLTVAEYLILTLASIVLVTGLAYLLFRNILFLTGILGGFFLPRVIVGIMKAQRVRKFNNQLGDTINLLVNSIRSGYSMPQAMESVARDMPPPVAEEFRRVVLEIGLGVPLEDALAH